MRQDVLASRGASDAAYIRRLIQLQRRLELGGRAVLLFSSLPPAWLVGTAGLSVAKILENMEIGHNVLHGQWDWMRDPDIHSTTWEWDFVTPPRSWKHTHNDLHHTLDQRRRQGQRRRATTSCGWTRTSEWQPCNLGNPLYNALLAPVFEWGIAVYDLELGRTSRRARSPRSDLAGTSRPWAARSRNQFAKDYVATPAVAALTGSFVQALLGTLTANAIRNVWAHAVIFCGHFPDGTDTFTEEMIEGETRGDWYVRQMIGSANISGSKAMHLMTGNLSHQIEHHLFPDLPSNRYAEVAPKVQEICSRYGLPYTTGPLPRQVGSAWKQVIKLSLPNDFSIRDTAKWSLQP